MKSLIPLALIALALVTHVPASHSAEAAPGFVKFATEKVVVFKDGYALVIKKGKGRTDARGEIHTLEVPDAAVLGSFWATTPEAGALLGMRAGWREEEATEEVEEIALDNLAILRANVGARCELVTERGETLAGVIREVLVRETVANFGPDPASAGPVWRGSAIGVPQPPAGAGLVEEISSTATTFSGTHFVLRTEGGDVLLAAGSVRSLSIPEMKTKNLGTVTRKTRSKRLTFRFSGGGEGKEHEITMMYFRPGVRWIPTYRVDLPEGEKKVAEVSLQAEILNEAEDLIEVPIAIVVGVPNFRFKTTPSPLALESVLRNTLAQAEPLLMGQMRNDFSNASYSMRSGESRREGAAATAGDEVELPGELTGGGAQDLFVYSLPKMRLRKGDRAAVGVFEAEVPYRDVYTWDLHLAREDIATAPGGAGIDSPLNLSTHKVWHQIELTNTTRMPWTTGAVMIMQGQQPLAQELLTYTSPNDFCRVPVTVSVETRGSFTEEEVGRKMDALVWDGYNYAKIDNRASLHLCNNKPSPIEVEIAVSLGGRVTEASDEGAVTLLPFNSADWQNYRGSPAVNHSSVVKWKVALDPGETFEPTIDYSFHARH